MTIESGVRMREEILLGNLAHPASEPKTNGWLCFCFFLSITCQPTFREISDKARSKHPQNDYTLVYLLVTYQRTWGQNRILKKRKKITGLARFSALSWCIPKIF